MNGMITDAIRSVLWGITSACLTLMDVAYELVVKVASIDFVNNSDLWKWWGNIMCFLTVFIVIRVIALFLKFSFYEEFRDKWDGFKLIKSMMIISLVLLFFPMVTKYAASVSVWAVQNTGIILGSKGNVEPSSTIITAFANVNNGYFNKKGEWIEKNTVTYKLSDITDINESDPTGKNDYKFFNSMTDMFLIAIIGIGASFLLLVNSVVIGKRSLAIVLKVMVAPIPISSLVVPDDDTFKIWIKMLISDLICNFMQVLMLMIVVLLSTATIVTKAGRWIQILVIISGFFLLLEGVPDLAKILGGDLSSAGVIQQLASLRMATRGVGHTIVQTGKAAAKVAGAAGSAIGYGIGRAAGGMSIDEYENSSMQTSQNNQNDPFSEENRVANGPSLQSNNHSSMNPSSQAHSQAHMNADNDTNSNNAFANANDMNGYSSNINDSYSGNDAASQTGSSFDGNSINDADASYMNESMSMNDNMNALNPMNENMEVGLDGSQSLQMNNQEPIDYNRSASNDIGLGFNAKVDNDSFKANQTGTQYDNHLPGNTKAQNNDNSINGSNDKQNVHSQQRDNYSQSPVTGHSKVNSTDRKRILTRANTPADKFANYAANEKNPVVGVPARLVSNTSGHIYQSSMQRVNKMKLYNLKGKQSLLKPNPARVKGEDNNDI